MKRPVTLVLVATLLASAPAFAESAFSSKVAERVKTANHVDGNRGNDRGHDNRGNDHRGGDRGNQAPPASPHEGGGHDRNDHRGDNGNNHGSNRGNDHGNNHGSDNRNDHRYDNNRHDWNDGRSHHGNDDTRHDSHYNGNVNRGWDHQRSDWSNHPNYWDNRRHDRNDYARYRYHYGYYRAPYGYHYRVWHRGEYLPRAYYGSSYIVYDWQPYRLYAPPYGYHWVRVGNDVVLTALATGIVLDVLYNIWY